MRPTTFSLPRIRYTTDPTVPTTSGWLVQEDPWIDHVGTRWLAPAAPTTINVEVDYGGMRLTGVASSRVQNADGSTSLRGVHWCNKHVAGWYHGGDDDAVGHWPLTGSATGAGGNFHIDFNGTTTGATITVQNGGTGAISNSGWVVCQSYAPSPRDIRRDELRRKLRPNVINHRGVSARSAEKGRAFDDVSPEELMALSLLRKMVAPGEFKRYLKHGFVHVCGPSGLVYQIGRRELVKVWDQGVAICTLCVHLKDGRIPPTDAVVAKMLIAECDEPDLWRRANVRWLETSGATRPIVQTLLAA